MIFGTRLITWSRIGEIDGNDLYLCDTMLDHSVFGETHQYQQSSARDKCRNMYISSFSDNERNRLVPHPEIGDYVFLLSEKEYMKYKSTIKPLMSIWWLRSRGYFPNSANYVVIGGDVSDCKVSYEAPGFRPAIIIKKGEQL